MCLLEGRGVKRCESESGGAGGDGGKKNSGRRLRI